MIPARIHGATRAMGKDQPEYITLWIKDEVIDGCPVMTAVFEPTPLELAHLMGGGKVVLSIMGTVWPPVLLTAKPHNEDRGQT